MTRKTAGAERLIRTGKVRKRKARHFPRKFLDKPRKKVYNNKQLLRKG